LSEECNLEAIMFEINKLKEEIDGLKSIIGDDYKYTYNIETIYDKIKRIESEYATLGHVSITESNIEYLNIQTSLNTYYLENKENYDGVFYSDKEIEDFLNAEIFDSNTEKMKIRFNDHFYAYEKNYEIIMEKNKNKTTNFRSVNSYLYQDFLDTVIRVSSFYCLGNNSMIKYCVNKSKLLNTVKKFVFDRIMKGEYE